jgi:hypothetical protein
LNDKGIQINNADELSSGNCFLELIHSYHPKSVDLSKAYIKPKNDYEVLQNFKCLVQAFSKLGWKRFDPDRYTKQK